MINTFAGLKQNHWVYEAGQQCQITQIFEHEAETSDVANMILDQDVSFRVMHPTIDGERRNPCSIDILGAHDEESEETDKEEDG